jgi:hypothetical protein
MKPKKISSLVNHVLSRDADASVYYTGREENRLHVLFTSYKAYFFLKEEIDLDIVTSGTTSDGFWSFTIVWDCSSIGEKKLDVEPYCFGDSVKRDREKINEQEDRLGEIIGGKRHIGSGAIEGYKSDASGDYWQGEAKSTKAKSFNISLIVLKKITLEARTQGKKPIMHIWFKNNDTVAEDEWVMITADEFERMNDS